LDQGQQDPVLEGLAELVDLAWVFSLFSPI